MWENKKDLKCDETWHRKTIEKDTQVKPKISGKTNMIKL